MMFRILIFSLICCLFLPSCISDNQTIPEQIAQSYDCKTDFAKGFLIKQEGLNFRLIVKNPWQGANGIQFNYIFKSVYDTIGQIPTDFQLISYPAKRVVALSTTHVAFIDRLSELKSIIAVSGNKYIYNPELREKMNSGLIPDVGYDQSLDFEKLIKLKPDIVFVFGVGSEFSAYIQKFKELHIPFFFVGEYLEENPLARAEWLKAISLFFGKYELATQIFDSIKHDYIKLKEFALNYQNKPTVISGLPWRNVWYVPGNQSYLANLIADAGGKYIWENLKTSETVALGIEEVFFKARSSSIWINAGTAHSLAEINSCDERLIHFSAYHNKLVFNNNARLNSYGGNDYWESGCINPHLILSDLIKIIHEENPDSMYYYRKLE